MDEKKTVESLDEVFAAGDAWLRKYGMVTNIAHNSIVTNLYVNFPKVRYLEYFLPEDSSRKKVWVILYVPFWKLLFTNRDRLADDVIAFLREYLDSYDIKVELKRYKKGVEKNEKIPDAALGHVAVPAELSPDEVKPAASGTEPQPASAEPAGGTDQAGSSDPEPESGDVGAIPPSDSD